MKWTDEEEDKLIKLSFSFGVSRIAGELGRSESSVRHKLEQYEPIISVLKKSIDNLSHDMMALIKENEKIRPRVKKVLLIGFGDYNDFIQKIGKL